MRKFLFAPFFMLCAIFLLACPGDKDGNSGGGGGLAPGETRIDFTLSGGNLSETVRIHGTTTQPTVKRFDHYLSVTALGIEGVSSATSAHTLENLTMRIPVELGDAAPTSQTYDIYVTGFVNQEGAPRDYSFRAIEGESTLTVVEMSDQRAHFRFDGKASPTQSGAKDLVFNLSGEFEHRFD